MKEQAVYLHSSFMYRISDAIIWGIPTAAYLQFFHNKEQDFEYSQKNFDPTERIITKIDRNTIERVTGINKEKQREIENHLETYLIIDVKHLDEENISVFIKQDNYFKFRTNPHWYVKEFKNRGYDTNLPDEV